MTSTQIGGGVAGVLVVCWMVGAYNRMVSLRNVLVDRFAAIDALCVARHGLITRQVELLATTLAGAGPRLDALRAASLQAEAARQHAQARPGAASAVTSLRVAEEILAAARTRLPVQTMGGADLPEINAKLASGDATLDFARREFNAAVAEYNAAVRQFPTVLVASLFGFRPGATL
ncbi:MAG: LemA family protein [Burkholderiales bacterium]|nr:LemA family protein [Burkholderiales bacterium]